ncbi:MAG: ATP-dependent DNA helicase [Actinomycetaceae bacterium]|nr:ATP-dependent DNA helicase [Actinomycetaceae bacterium]MDU0970024.1 ATP-dependent DNA helicase [Actinomycetaceae bacterium]
MSDDPTPREAALALLAACRDSAGWGRREGQDTMCGAIADAIEDGHHLMVQAGTGTGKSLGYLAPVLPIADADHRVIISTATKALQRQLVTKDIPVIQQALKAAKQRRPVVATLKGWANYACLARLDAGDDADDSLFDVVYAKEPTSELGEEIIALREWAEDSPTGDRDDLTFPVTDRAWSLASISPRECPGDHCPFADRCHPRAARRRALAADVVVTNHALLGADAMSGNGLLGSYSVAVIDEAHELIARIRQTATIRLSGSSLDGVVKKLQRLGSVSSTALREQVVPLTTALNEAGEGLLDVLPQAIQACLLGIAEEARQLIDEIPTGKDQTNNDRVSRTLLAEVADSIDTILSAREGSEAVWISVDEHKKAHLTCAPIDVAPTLAHTLLEDHTVIFTSATLTLGGQFSALAAEVGLPMSGTPYEGIDVGSPFDYPHQGILYVAAHLDRPRQSGLSDEAQEELLALTEASRGGVLGLFSSRRALAQAAEALEDVDYDVFVQGDDHITALVNRFAADRDACLLGTLSLWQGVDVPGETCRLVVIDRIPFPRPDDPMGVARSRVAEQRGGSGFRDVSLTHAALLLAQGAGRLIRSDSDRGMVAILDSRMATARYGGYLRRSLPPLWMTQDAAVAHAALARLGAAL